MKNKIFLVSFFITSVGFSQNWKYESGKSDFDGSYKTSYVVGKGTDYPYNKPVLTINRFNDKENVNFYVSSAGYFQEGTNTNLKWVFDNEPSNIYTSYSFSFSSDGKIIFLDEFNEPKTNARISKYEFINKLKEATKVSLRISNKYGSNDIIFTLIGSTKAINFVIPNQIMESVIEKIVEERQVKNKFVEKQKIILDKLLNDAKLVKLSTSSLSSLKYQIENDLGIGLLNQNTNGENYKLLKFKPKDGEMFERYGYVDIFYVLDNGDEKEIYGSWTVEKESILFKENETIKKKKLEELEKLEAEKQKEKQKSVEKIQMLLEKYKNEDLQELMFESIVQEQKRSYLKKWELKNISNITSVFSEYKYGKIWNLEIKIQLENNEVITKTEYIYSLEINKKELKEMGGKLGVEF